MARREVRTAAELLAAIAAGDEADVVGDGRIEVEISGADKPLIRHFSGDLHVVARGSSQPHVVAKGCCQLSVRGAVRVIAAATVAILITGGTPKIEGGGFVRRVDRGTPEKWCEYYGLEAKRGAVVLYKAVQDDYR